MSSTKGHPQISKHTQQMIKAPFYSCFVLIINNVALMVIIMKLKYNYEVSSALALARPRI
jgi:hypothetical protein